jgi:nucleoside-diphosphate-sugar epimerase
VSARARCLITGASGFIGGRLAQRLAGEDAVVRCLVRPTSDTSALQALGAELVVGDLTDPAALGAAVDGCRYVFHCAALVSDWAAPREIARVNVTGTRELLTAARDAGVARLIHLSSTDVYGYPGDREVDESRTPSRFRNWYAQTKLAAELEVRRVADASGPATNASSMETVILRPATVYGPGSREVVLEIARAIRNRNMVLIGGGRAVAGLCFVENLVDLALIAMTHDDAPGQAFNATDGIATTWREFVDALADGLGSPRVRWSIPFRLAEPLGLTLEQGYRLLHRTTGLTTRPLLSRQAVQVMGIDQSFSNRRARELLGWEPRVDYAAGLRATLDWLHSQGA